MKILNSVLLVLLLLSVSCASANKNLRKNKKHNSPVTAVTDPRERETGGNVALVKEIEEKLVPIENVAPDPAHYFVIIGSFRNHENAKRYLYGINAKGFSPEILLSESGLYRVSVMSTDDINAARTEVRRIWSVFPEHNDTWLLIRIN